MIDNDDLNRPRFVKGSTSFAILFMMLIVPVLIYTTRAMISKIVAYPIEMQAPFLLNAALGAVMVSIITAALYAAGRVSGFFKPHPVKAPIRVAALIGAILIARVAPVLATTEQLYFDQHRDEFMHQVNLIQQGQPVHRFNHLGVYTLPNSQAIVFSWYAENFNSEYVYVYTEDYAEVAAVVTCSATDGSGGVGQLYATLAPNWYLCYRTGD